MPSPFSLLIPILFGAQLLLPSPAHALLQAVGDEFRPTTAQRLGTDPCIDADGVKASVVFASGTLWAEWRTGDGEHVAGPVFITEWDYWYSLSHSCSDDGTIYLLLEPGLHIVGREGVRSVVPRVCEAESDCWGPFDVAPGADGFLVTWIEEGRGIVGRRFDADGKPTAGAFLIAEDEDTRARLRASGDDTLVAWRRSGEIPAIMATLVGKDGSVAPVLQVNQFARLEFDVWPVVHTDGSSGFLVAWNNSQYQGGWVARRLETSTNPTTTSTTTTTLDVDLPQFLPVKQLGDRPWGNPARPHLAGDESGRWLASWPDRIDWNEDEVAGSVATSSVDDALQWTAPETFHAEEYPGVFETALAGDGSGTVIDAWENGDDTSILFRRSTDGGLSWSDAAALYVSEFVPQGGEGDSSIRSLAVFGGTNDRWLASWTEEAEARIPCPVGDDTCEDGEWVTLICAIRSSVSTDGGVTWSAARTIADDICDTETGPEIAGDGNGNWLAVWMEGTEDDEYLRSAFSSDDGAHWSEPRRQLRRMELTEAGVSVAATGDGHWLIAFVERRYDPPTGYGIDQFHRILVSRTDDPSGTWNSPVGIAPWHDVPGGRDESPSIAVGADGEIAIAWSSHSGGSGLDADIVIAFSGDGGKTWSPARPVDPDAGHDALSDVHPRLIRVGPVWAVAWQTEENARPILFARTRGNCGNGDLDANEQCDDGNSADGDDCDSNCLPTGCGSQIVTGEEECDDGNLDESDDCVQCSHAFCGDGAVHSGVEPCDDGNSVDTDACLSSCTIARCGDALVYVGTETCDDGAVPGNNDDCLDQCSLARCGDGYLNLGEEECDDGNLLAGDGCSGGCLLEPQCGLLNRSGLRVTASNALTVLRRAVGRPAPCPLRNCDLNADGNVGVIDALWTLRSAVGLFVEGCSWPNRLVLRLESNETVSALMVRIAYTDAAGRILADLAGDADCSVLPSALSVIHWVEEERWLRLGIVTVEGLQGPLDIMSCRYDPVSGPSLRDFQLEIEEASDDDADPIEPPPVFTLTLE